MRIRSIKPEFWRSPDITELAIEDRLLFIGLWSYVDDNGVGQDRLASIVADLFAGDLETDAPGTFARVSRGLARLHEAGRIVRYTVENTDYLEVVNWSKHQRIDKPGKARFPRSTDDSATIRDTLPTSRDFPAPGTGEQGNRGTGEQGTDVTYETLSVTEVDARANNVDEPVMDQLSRKAHERAAGLNITDLPTVRGWLEKATGQTLTLGQAVELAGSIIGRAKTPVESGDRYVIGTCRKSPARVAAYADDLDLEVVA